MSSRFLVFGALGIACVMAAGGGAYLAVRQMDTRAQAPMSQAAPPQALPSEQTAAVNPATQSAPEPAKVSPPASPAPAPEKEAATTAPRETAVPENPQARRPWPERRAPEPVATAPETAATGVAADLAAAGEAVPQTVAPPPTAQLPEPEPAFVELTVASESVLGLQLQTSVSSETAQVEDRVEARVTRDVRVGERVAVPAGSEVVGNVVQVDRGGKLKERARIAVRFNTLILPDGTRTSITAEAVHRVGPPPSEKAAGKIGGAAIGGAILGAILGGGKGAAIGGSIGAAGGTAATMAGDRQPAVLQAGTIVNVRLMAPLTVTLQR
jgi:type IV secretory pathway VirB10-like protein